MHDLKYAIRSLLKSPGFAVIAIATLALCIGANSAIFSVVHAILLKPYPWPESEKLVYVYNTYPLMGLPNAGVSIPDYLDRRAGVAGFADTAMFTNRNYNLASDGEPERIGAQDILAQHVMGVACGEAFNEDALYAEIRSCAPYRDLSREDARQIAENLTGFFSVLAEWSRAELRSPANDASAPDASENGEARHDR